MLRRQQLINGFSLKVIFGITYIVYCVCNILFGWIYFIFFIYGAICERSAWDSTWDAFKHSNQRNILEKKIDKAETDQCQRAFLLTTPYIKSILQNRLKWHSPCRINIKLIIYYQFNVRISVGAMQELIPSPIHLQINCKH